MRWQSRDEPAWEARRQQIVQHYQQTRNAAETARAFGISRERVRQIVKKMEAKDGAVRQDREVLGGNGLHAEGGTPEN